MARGHILKARIFEVRRFNKQKRVANKNRFVFNMTYHPVFSNLKNILSEIHLLLTPDREHRKVFEKIPIIGIRKTKSLKDVLVSTKVAPLERTTGYCR